MYTFYLQKHDLSRINVNLVKAFIKLYGCQPFLRHLLLNVFSSFARQLPGV